MNHSIVFSIAPVITVLDDDANILNVFAVPITRLLFLPCALYALLFRLSYNASRWRAGWGEEWQSWKGDLKIMKLAIELFWRPELRL